MLDTGGHARTDNSRRDMIQWGVELLIIGVVILTVAVVPMVSPVVGLWLTVLLIVLNGLMLLPTLLTFVSPQLSLALMTAMSHLIHLPFWRLMDFHAHLRSHVPPLQVLRTWSEGIHIAGEEPGGGARGWRDGVAGWLRQLVFVLTVVLCHTDVGVITLLLRFLLWLLGIHSLLAPFAAVLTLLTFHNFELTSASFSSTTSSNIAMISLVGADLDDFSSSSLPVYFVELVVGILCMIHCAYSVSLWELLGLLVFSVCSDQRVQNTLKLQARKLQVDIVEGFEGELLHGGLILLDLAVCVAFFVHAVRQEDYPVLVLSYCNAFVAVMEMRVRVWLEMQAGLRRMSELRRATSMELAAHNDVCAVCLGAMSAARVTRCRHLFHGKCLRQALRISPQCPLCKKHVVTHSVYLFDPATAQLEG